MAHSRQAKIRKEGIQVQQDQRKVKASIAFWIGLVCIATYVVNYYLRHMLGVTTPELLASGAFTETGVALLSSTYMLFYAGGQLVNGFLGDILPTRMMILLGVGVGGGMILTFPFLQNATLRIICFAILGFSLSMVRGPMMKIISENTEPKQARLICVFFSFASFAGPLVASLFVLALSAHYAFILSGVLAALCALIAFAVLSLMQKKQVIVCRPMPVKSLSSLLDVFRIEGFGFYMIVSCLVEISAASVSFWIPTFLSSYLSFPTDTSNLIFSAISICRACMPFLSLTLFNATGEKPLPIMAIAFALSASFFLLIQLFSQPILIVLLMLLALMSMSCASAMLWSIYIPGLGKTGRASSANGVLDCAGYIAAALANLLFSRFASGAGWPTVLLLWASVGIIGLIATLFQRSKKKS